MTDARLAATFLEVAYSATAPDARLAATFLEVAYSVTNPQARLASALLEVATSRFSTTQTRGWGIIR